MASTTIVLAEPDKGFAQDVKNRLQPFGFAVAVVANADELLKQAEAQSAQLVLISAELPPNKSGTAACNRVKSQLKLKSIPVALLWTNATPALENHKKLATHADAYFQKANVAELVAWVKDRLPNGAGAAAADAPSGPGARDPLSTLGLTDSDVTEGESQRPSEPAGGDDGLAPAAPQPPAPAAARGLEQLAK